MNVMVRVGFGKPLLGIAMVAIVCAWTGCAKNQSADEQSGAGVPSSSYNKSNPETIAIIKKYSNPPATGNWELVSDSDELCRDVNALHDAADNGDPDALRTLLMIETYTDGAVSEGMPETYSVVEHHKQMARQVILGNDRLRAHFGHWLDENCRPM